MKTYFILITSALLSATQSYCQSFFIIGDYSFIKASNEIWAVAAESEGSGAPIYIDVEKISSDLHQTNRARFLANSTEATSINSPVKSIAPNDKNGIAILIEEGNGSYNIVQVTRDGHTFNIPQPVSKNRNCKLNGMISNLDYDAFYLFGDENGIPYINYSKMNGTRIWETHLAATEGTIQSAQILDTDRYVALLVQKGGKEKQNAELVIFDSQGSILKRSKLVSAVTGKILKTKNDKVILLFQEAKENKKVDIILEIFDSDLRCLSTSKIELDTLPCKPTQLFVGCSGMIKVATVATNTISVFEVQEGGNVKLVLKCQLSDIMVGITGINEVSPNHYIGSVLVPKFDITDHTLSIDTKVIKIN